VSYVDCKGPGPGPTRWCQLALADLRQLDPRGRGLGCYNPRRDHNAPRLWSLHACGRAVDWRPEDRSRGWEVARWIAWFGHADLQLIIFDGQQWGGRARLGWRPFHGRDQHHDHIHIESRVDHPTVHITTGAPVN